VLADIHANLPALEAVLDDLSGLPVDGVIAAGDMVCGPQANEVLERLCTLDAWMIRGNNEHYMLKFASDEAPEAWKTLRQYGFMRRSYELMNRASLEMIAGLEDQRTLEIPGSSPMRIVHGSPRYVNHSLFPDRDLETLVEILDEIPEDVLVCGHTHLPWHWQVNGKLALNPGAVTGGLNGDPRAQYALLAWDGEGWRAELRGVRYDLDRIHQAYRDSGLLEEGGPFVRAVLLSFRSGKNVPTAFIEFAITYARQAGWTDGASIPDEIWMAAEAAFDWEAWKV
jgi:putative phosphoesterase